jgi:uncharacterized membrane protein YqiK
VVVVVVVSVIMGVLPWWFLLVYVHARAREDVVSRCRAASRLRALV